MKLSNFDYELPPDRIAQVPLKQRDESKLMVVNRHSGELQHTQFARIKNYLPESALLVLNDTKVIPARLIGNKRGTGGKIELLLIQETEKDVWEVLAKPMRSLKVGTQLVFEEDVLSGEVIEKTKNGKCLIAFSYIGEFYNLLSEIGLMPLPPYIRRTPDEDDKLRYQSVYASQEGAIAAPTAGLHFTQELLEKLNRKGIQNTKLTLHVGIGTFQPVKVDNIKTHKMHAEYINLKETVAQRINDAKRTGSEIIAIGTTVVRALETAGVSGTVEQFNGQSELFIYPGFQFKIVDALITNFHLPKSTLLMLVSAFADTQLIKKAYQEALQHNYRFYSYGDAMLIR
ncbi:tRNA preQ1(34) S-adenosylmethionine ribosyltransferase-isomerase QueA [Candidatus Poribacteria bacterium]|nr:tRNA preQ1(34) S-adenosylmethionine ribosyltransferase-isomerase QueA [Candidatus Poribacteria bacterium]MYF57365.1 tRNA preQ1(34) S-adenosylmethionine ribosyltransferase-isomerase QueA [Candidatus Poribacteria bacterium]